MIDPTFHRPPFFGKTSALTFFRGIILPAPLYMCVAVRAVAVCAIVSVTALACISVHGVQQHLAEAAGFASLR